ncbi:C39 family peptidase [Planomicrobium okeanokoites]|uniref:C39 family peptidase n=1 Tax=Planomicrobium okeanokoites TaxID=244 RepID=UPI0030F963C9
MKTSHKLIRFGAFFALSFFIVGFSPSSLGTSFKKIMADGFAIESPEQNVSSETFLLTNSRNGQPLENYLLYIIDTSTSTLVDVIKSDEPGEMKADALVDGKEYRIRIVRADTDSGAVKLAEETMYLHQPDDLPTTIETYVEREATHINVPILMQDPELPNGCEITTLTSALNHYRLKVSKTTMADDYLPKSSFTFKNGKRFGPDPHQAYAGDPRKANGGWYVFAEPIVEAAKGIIDSKSSRLIAENVSGSTKEEILSYTDRNIPVIVWVTLDLSPPVTSGGWYIEETGDFHPSYSNLHSVVLDGWEDGNVYVMDPLKGRVSYPEKMFFDSYQAMGSQAVIVRR